jgi:hypothetical protein
VLSRHLRYCERRYGLKRDLMSVGDRRRKPQLPTFSIVAGLFFMVIVQLGSLNGIEQALRGCPAGCIWHDWVEGKLPSADRLGEVAALLDMDQLRAVLLGHYRQRRRKKTLWRFAGKWSVLVLDGHELGASYLRGCEACSKRRVKVRGGKVVQSYHRYVLAYLLGERDGLLLDLEMQGPGEAEMPAARRLLRRLLRACPRGFDVVAGDALYLDPALCREVLAVGKHFIAVLKNESRDLLVDFRQLQKLASETQSELGKRACKCQDIEGLETWPQVGRAVRVVGSEEEHTVVRQRTRQAETTRSTWVWATSLSSADMGTEQLVELGHRRWDIENRGFNELVTNWHADHVYHHNVDAMTAILLLTFLAYNLFHVWQCRNLQPELREGRTIRFFERQLQADFLISLCLGRSPP